MHHGKTEQNDLSANISNISFIVCKTLFEWNQHDLFIYTMLGCIRSKLTGGGDGDGKGDDNETIDSLEIVQLSK